MMEVDISRLSLLFALGYSINDKWGSYLEYYGSYPDGGRDDLHNLATGLTYLVNDDFQLDLRVGMGLNDEADDFFAGVGFSFRF